MKARARILTYSKNLLLGDPEDDKILDIELTNALNKELSETLTGVWDQESIGEFIHLSCVSYVDGDDTIFLYTLLYR